VVDVLVTHLQTILSYYDIKAKDKTQMTALHVAASHGWVTISKLLIEAGANIRSLDEEQMTPLHFACMEGNHEIAKLLFDAGKLMNICICDYDCS